MEHWETAELLRDEIARNILGEAPGPASDPPWPNADLGARSTTPWLRAPVARISPPASEGAGGGT